MQSRRIDGSGWCTVAGDGCAESWPSKYPHVLTWTSLAPLLSRQHRPRGACCSLALSLFPAAGSFCLCAHRLKGRQIPFLSFFFFLKPNFPPMNSGWYTWFPFPVNLHNNSIARKAERVAQRHPSVLHGWVEGLKPAPPHPMEIFYWWKGESNFQHFSPPAAKTPSCNSHPGKWNCLYIMM